MYGLKSDGNIYTITTATASVGTTPLDGTTTAAPGATSNANAMGYNSVNGKFYFWAETYSSTTKCTGPKSSQTCTTTTTTAAFDSYDPVTNTYQSLNAGGPGFTTIRTGCVSADGLGYYCLNSNGALWYYNIAGNSWTAIDSVWKNQSGTDISTTIKAQTSGDMAIDGGGNLWLMTATTGQYGLYKITAPLPTTTVASITLQEILPTTSNPYNSPSTIAGIAFTNTGQIYMSTLSDSLFQLNSVTTDPVTSTKTPNYSYVGKFNVTGVGNDLTSCQYPMTVLPAKFTAFTVGAAGKNNVALKWTAEQGSNTQTYRVEHSINNIKWDLVGSVASNRYVGLASYSFNYSNTVPGRHYYRIVEMDADRHQIYSKVVAVTFKETENLSLWPSPSKSFINIQNNDNATLKAQIVTAEGLIVTRKILQPGNNTINITSLPNGSYLVSVQRPNGINNYLRFIKE